MAACVRWRGRPVPPYAATLVPVKELALAEDLVSYDTSSSEGLRTAAGFVKGWLESHGIDVHQGAFAELPVLSADVGARHGPTVIFHGHLDVVPGHAGQFSPRVDGDRLIGRGAYDMKGGLAAMMCALCEVAAQDAVRVRFVCVPDEESEEVDARSTDELVRAGLTGDFAITGEPTDLHIGVEAKGVLACRVCVSGRAAHGSTPWLGDNAVLKGLEVFRRIESLPFTRESSELFDRPSINLGRIKGGDRFNKVPDECLMDVDIRYLPGQSPDGILAQIAEIPDCEVVRTLTRAPAYVSRHDPHVRALADAIGSSTRGTPISVGRDGASDAISFLEAGIPAVEFGPSGAGHHGPDEWVSISSLAACRQTLCDFVHGLPAWLARADGPALRAVDAVQAAADTLHPTRGGGA
jgi:succinyl-diaminopimelate desuccinylase